MSEAVDGDLAVRAGSGSVSGLPDILAADLKVVFCGINPSLRSAMHGHPFINRTNRFWRVLHRAGFTPRELMPEEARMLLHYGCGLISAVGRPTVRAGELSRTEFLAARPLFDRKILRYRPRHLAFLGKQAYLPFFGVREVSWGRQPTRFDGTDVWVLPNTSGLNCAFTLDVLTVAYAELAAAAGF